MSLAPLWSWHGFGRFLAYAWSHVWPENYTFLSLFSPSFSSLTDQQLQKQQNELSVGWMKEREKEFYCWELLVFGSFVAGFFKHSHIFLWANQTNQKNMNDFKASWKDHLKSDASFSVSVNSFLLHWKAHFDIMGAQQGKEGGGSGAAPASASSSQQGSIPRGSIHATPNVNPKPESRIKGLKPKQTKIRDHSRSSPGSPMLDHGSSQGTDWLSTSFLFVLKPNWLHCATRSWVMLHVSHTLELIRINCNFTC